MHIVSEGGAVNTCSIEEDGITRNDEHAGSALAGGETGKRRRHRMTKQYSDHLYQIVEADRNVKRTEVRSLLIKRLGWEEEIIPEDFPSEDQVRRNITGLKTAVKKRETGMECI